MNCSCKSVLSEVDMFEIKARIFYDMTGFMAPGKDDPLPVDPEYRGEVYVQWDTMHGEIIERVFRAIEDYFKA